MDMNHKDSSVFSFDMLFPASDFLLGNYQTEAEKEEAINLAKDKEIKNKNIKSTDSESNIPYNSSADLINGTSNDISTTDFIARDFTANDMNNI